MKKNIEKAVEMVKAGSTCIEAAERCKVSVSGVTAACHRLGITVNARGARKREAPKRGSSIAKALTLVKNGASIPKAAKKVGISHQAIYAAIKRYEAEGETKKAKGSPKKDLAKKPTTTKQAVAKAKPNGGSNGVSGTDFDDDTLMTDDEIEGLARTVDDEYTANNNEESLFDDVDAVDSDELSDEF